MQHEDFNGFLAWSRDVPKPYLSRIMEVAVHFATSTGLCEVQGILPHLPGKKTTSQLDNTKRFNSRWPRLDAGPLVDPAPFVGIVFVGLVREDTAALVVVPEVGPETGLGNRAHGLSASRTPEAVQCFGWKRSFWAWRWTYQKLTAILHWKAHNASQCNLNTPGS